MITIEKIKTSIENQQALLKDGNEMSYVRCSCPVCGLEWHCLEELENTTKKSDSENVEDEYGPFN